ncbi:MAG: efflux RND transporter periplasmic adaptor subunit [Ruminococcus sp.]|nr:efflux RND transporter periplasmic adaptor subunit [Ruminococcus sp.]
MREYKNMKSNISLKLSALAVCSALMMSASGCVFLPDEEEVLSAPSVKTSDVKYTTVTAEKKTLEKKIVSSGVVTSENQYVQSYADNSGVIKKFYVNTGDVVKKGDKICSLDTTEIDYQIAEQELYLKKAQLDTQVIKNNKGSQAEIDRAGVEEELIEKKLDKLYDLKDGATLRAEADGTITYLTSKRAGDSAQPGETIVTILDTDALYIEIKPKNNDAKEYKMDQKVTIRVGDEQYKGTVFMTPKALTKYREEQKKSKEEITDKIDYQADAVYVRFSGKKSPASAVGQLGDVTLLLDKVEDAIIISNNLIKTVDGEQVVYVLKNGEKTAVAVEVGLQTGSQAEIKSGLSEGDELIIR